MNAQEVMETLAERVPEGLRDVASDVDRVARAAAERVPDGLRDVASDVDRVARAAAERAQADFDLRFEADRRAAERQRATAAAAVAVLVVVGIGVVIFVAQRRRSRRLQRFVERAQAAWDRATGRQPASTADRQPASTADRSTAPLADRPAAPVAIDGTGITAGGQWQEPVAQPATTTLEVERA